MHFFRKGFFFISILFIFSNCTGDGTASVEEAAKKICECTQPVVALNQKMEALKRNGKIEELTTLMEKAGKAIEEAKKCSSKNISEKTDKEKLKNAIIKTCQVDERMAKDLIP